ncbi:poly-gamma-glutamate hydrolase family protein [Halomarina oriensis]|uniref:Uncharacterized protein n=1 Tax=Halomarina oriensis TaxID=671145 RepID=A0A6B0GRV2_9EURY|nr:poly-gamma-glutamate hydrolase family protein [Halomarina oriensis]MWG36399.1 hypothetical protein [Halomarina oriensis]
MTDDTHRPDEPTSDHSADDSTDSTEATDGTSRRAFLAAGLASPALLGLGVGAVEANARSSALSTVVQQDTEADGRDTASVTVDFPGGSGPDSLAESFTELTADPALLDALGVAPGQQVRVRRTDDEYAAYTVAGARQERADDTVRIDRRARCRLALDELNWENTGDKQQGCPTYEGGCSLADESFDAVVDPVLPAPDMTVEEARENDELVEVLDYDERSLVVALAPHGGDVEAGTAEQAERFAASYDPPVTTWRTYGFRDGGGAFVRWHVPSTQLSPASFPKLASITDHTFRFGVSFHGTCTARVRVGGNASEETREAVRDAIAGVLPDSMPTPVLAEGRYAATDEDVLINELTDDDGIWVGQPKSVRDEHGDAVADAVADALNRRT